MSWDGSAIIDIMRAFGEDLYLIKTHIFYV